MPDINTIVKIFQTLEVLETNKTQTVRKQLKTTKGRQLKPFESNSR